MNGLYILCSEKYIFAFDILQIYNVTFTSWIISFLRITFEATLDYHHAVVVWNRSQKEKIGFKLNLCFPKALFL